MNVRINHKGSDISSHVIRYDREHKICTGIGLLELEVAYDYGSGFDPWDLIEIIEDGNLVGKYYVSVVSEGQPSATIVITAQDNSKRLSDYFIPETYLIDYPSYSRYWIELFLKQAGVSYTFSTTSQGNVLSNNTSLGLTTAYEQIMMLLQLNGWYITFSPSGRALIGKLSSIGNPATTFGNNDIIEIAVDKNDRMYRNRVVVWGNGDPDTGRWVFADVNKPTKWDYGVKDKRTIVISNSNIPTVSAAFSLANQALLEFCKLNVEKYITVTGARAIGIGDTVAVKNRVFSGKGLVTTCGSSMSKEGFVTNVVLDERCPRLFGFFNPGGYVYVGTYGSGVWRKHILSYSGYSVSGVALSGFASGVVPSGWFDYSTGLNDKRVTDLHVHAGALACVTASGQIYYSLENETNYSGAIASGDTSNPVWSGITLSGMQVTYSGVLLDPTVYSGLMGRACIIDRDKNLLRYAIDNRTVENLGDYLMETDPFGTGQFGSGILKPMALAPSGVPASGSAFPSGISFTNYRSWVLDADPYDGVVLGRYPVWMSGVLVSGVLASGVVLSGYARTFESTYNMSVYDIENDGSYDYVSAMTVMSGRIPTDYYQGRYETRLCRTGGWNDGLSSNFGTTYIQSSYSNVDNGTINTTIAFSGVPFPVLQNPTYVASQASTAPAAVYEIPGINKVFIAGFPSDSITVTDITTNPDASVSTVHHTKPFVGLTSYNLPQACRMLSTNLFRFYYLNKNHIVQFKGATPAYIDYNIATETTNLVEFDTDIDIICTGWNESYDGPGSETSERYAYIIVGSDLIAVRPVLYTDPMGFDIEIIKVNLDTGSRTSKIIGQARGNGVYPTEDGSAQKYYPALRIYPYGESGYRILGRYFINIAHQPTDTRTFKIVRLRGEGFNEIMQEEIHSQDVIPERSYDVGLNQANSTMASINYSIRTGGVDFGIKDYYDSYQLDVLGADSGFINFGNSNYTIVKEFSGPTVTGFNIIEPVTKQVIRHIGHPAGYTLITYQGKDSYSDDLFFAASTDGSTTIATETIAINISGVVTRRRVFRNGTMQGDFTMGVPIRWIQPGPLDTYYPLYLVLQRDGYDYNVVKSGIYRDRLDISNYSPLVTMARTVSTTETYFISTDNSVLQTTHVGISGYNLGVESMSGSMFALGYKADDFRYTTFDTAIESGGSIQLLVAYSGGLGSMDIMGSGVSFSGLMLSPSGYINRLEASNYAYPDQYLFVSVSGYVNGSGEWGFYQKSPTTISGIAASGLYTTLSGMFVDCSDGYPQARTTIIRLDDKL